MADTKAKPLSENEVNAILEGFDRDASREIRAADAVAEALAHGDAHVPLGIYCYAGDQVCPFWALVPELPDGLNGYCAKMRSGDWEGDGASLIWDRVKECGIAEDVIAEGDLLMAGEKE